MKEEFTKVESDEWVKPVMENYLMACCDCGLVHEIDFRVVEVIEHFENGDKAYAPAPNEYEVEFRARRFDNDTVEPGDGG